MPSTVSFGNIQPTSSQTQPIKPFDQPLAKLTTPQDTVRFGKKKPKPPVTPEAPDPANGQTPAAQAGKASTVQKPEITPELTEEAEEKKQPAETNNGNWFTKRAKTIWPAIKESFNGGSWNPIAWPFKGWKSDLTQASIITLPLTILPGSQLILIPIWMTLGGIVRSTVALGRGMFWPDTVLNKLKPKNEQAQAEEAS